MRLFIVVFTALLLSGCISGASIADAPLTKEDTPQELPQTSGTEQPTIAEPPLGDAQKAQSDSERERILKARGFGIFDFSILTKDNCPTNIDKFKNILLTSKDRLDSLEEKVKAKQLEVIQLQQQLTDALSLGDSHTIKRARDSLDDATEEFEELEDDEEDAEEFVGKVELLIRTMKEECKRIGVT